MRKYKSRDERMRPITSEEHMRRAKKLIGWHSLWPTLMNLRPGEVTVYYTGFLSRDCDKESASNAARLYVYDNQTVREGVMALYEAGHIHLVQRKIDTDEYEYQAVRTR